MSTSYGQIWCVPTERVSRLISATPELQLRVGNYRELSKVEEQPLCVYRLMRRKRVDTERRLIKLHPQFIGKEGSEKKMVPLRAIEFRVASLMPASAATTVNGRLCSPSTLPGTASLFAFVRMAPRHRY
jgi:hypothetical protein